MSIASLTFANFDWFWPLAVTVGLACILLWWAYRATPQGATRWVCLSLKLIGILALAVCLLEPLWTGQRAQPGANLFAIVADNSQGLQIHDLGETQTRGERLQALLLQDAGDWQAALEEDFELRRFTFDSRLRVTRRFENLTFDGRASALGAALRGIEERFQGRPLGGVLLFTDGNATDAANMPEFDAGWPPVYPVVLGHVGGASDVAIANVNITQTAFEDAPVTIQANARAIGLGGETVVVQLFDADGTKIEEKESRTRRNDDTLAFRFQLRPEQSGIKFYRLKTTLQSEQDPTAEASKSQEATLLNNSRVIAVDRGSGPHRVLYVTGRPNWEYKFLNRAVAEDPEVQMVGLIRVARREARFDFRGRSGETSNPLFRGVEDQSHGETERYDEPVIMRLNTRDEFELRGGFPGVEEELYGYDAVILDDVEADYFTADQMTLLQRYVSERGGGLLMLGGMESFVNGGYPRTPVGDMLPVYLRQVETRRPEGGLQMDLAREGWLEAWARLRDNEQEERVRLQSMPPFQVMNTVGDIKPGASVVATATDEQNRDFPVLITQRFGRGRTSALTIGDIWRWGMQDRNSREDMNKFWRQLVRWLIADVPEKMEFTVQDASIDNTGAVNLQVRVRNDEFKPVDDASVTIEVRNALALTTNGTAPDVIRLRAEAASTEAGLYIAEYVARHTGGYHAVAQITNSAGMRIGQAEAGWSVDLAAEEFASLEPNITQLEDIARRTGGEIIAASRLNAFTRDLSQRKSPVMEPWTQPAWHTPAIFLFALACFVGEWGLRRWKGMP